MGKDKKLYDMGEAFTALDLILDDPIQVSKPTELETDVEVEDPIEEKEGIKIYCPDMTLWEMKDYCEIYDCEVTSLDDKGHYLLIGSEAARVEDKLKADGFINTVKVTKSITNEALDEQNNSDTINESREFKLNDPKEIEKAKEFIDSNKEKETIEQVVDIDADSIDDIKPSYVGKVILECPVCGELFYKSKEELIKDEVNPELFNVGEECPTCINSDGFKLVGEVVPLNDEEKEEHIKHEESETPEEEHEEHESEEEESEEHEDEKKDEEDSEEESKEESYNESLEDANFEKINNELISKYGEKIYDYMKEYIELPQNKEQVWKDGFEILKDKDAEKLAKEFPSRHIAKRAKVGYPELYFQKDEWNKFIKWCNDNKELNLQMKESMQIEEVDQEEKETPIDTLSTTSYLPNTLNDLIIDEFEAITKYSQAIDGFKAQITEDTSEDETTKYNQIISTLTDIVKEENHHVGQLQQTLSLISSNSLEIKAGQNESTTSEEVPSDKDIKVEETTNDVEDIDEEKFDALIGQYLKENLDSISYKTKDALFTKDNKIKLIGELTEKAGTTKDCEFIFGMEKDSDKIKLVGINEKLMPKATPMKITAKIESKKLIPELTQSQNK